MQLVQRRGLLEIRRDAERGRDVGLRPERAEERVERDGRRRVVRVAADAPEEPEDLRLANARGACAKTRRRRRGGGGVRLLINAVAGGVRGREAKTLQMELERDGKRLEERRDAVRARGADLASVQPDEVGRVARRRRDAPKDLPALPEAVVRRVRPEDEQKRQRAADERVDACDPRVSCGRA